MRKTFLLTLFAVTFYIFTYQQLPAVHPPDPESTVNPLRTLKTNFPTGSKLTRVNFDDSIEELYQDIGLEAYDLSYDVFRLGMIGYLRLQNEGALSDKGLLTIINFEQPSTEKRFYTIDIINKKVKYHSFVAHGRNTGDNEATRFSNTPNSNQSSLGFYVTGETYVGSKGFSLRLDGLEQSFNDQIRSRAVVIHAADYATEKWIKRYGRLGRSQGCPALPPDLNRDVINTIKGKTAIFSYYPDATYLNASRYLDVEDLFQKLDENPIDLTTNVIVANQS